MNRILVCASRISHILNFHLPYLKYFKDKGYIIDVAAEGSCSSPFIDNCYDLSFVKNPLSAQNLKTVSALKALMKKNQYSLVYSNSTLAGAAAKAAAKQLGKEKPYLVHISHGYMFSLGGGMSSTVYRMAEKLTASAVDELVVMNSEDYMLAKKFRLGKKLHFINGMGLCPERFPEISTEQRKETRRRLGVGDSQRLLLCVGEFSRRKNQAMLLEAFDTIHRRHPDTFLAFAGSGKTVNECRLTSEKLELGHWVRFLGHQEDINTLYRSSDLLLSASLMEGLPFNVMEALYCRLPVAASRIKGHTDLLKNESFGLLFDNNAFSAANAVSGLLSESSKLLEMKKNAHLDDKYMIENAAPALLKILDKNYLNENKQRVEEGVSP